MPPLSRANLMQAYQSAIGAGEAPKYVVVGSIQDEINVKELIAGLHLELRTAYDPHLHPGEWKLV
jgi:hypothetical protein